MLRDFFLVNQGVPCLVWNSTQIKINRMAIVQLYRCYAMQIEEIPFGMSNLIFSVQQIYQNSALFDFCYKKE